MTDMVSQPTNRGLLISPRGNELVLRLYNAIRSLVRARHDVSALHETIGRLLEEEGQVSIEIRRDRFLLNDRKVEMRSGHAVNRILLAELRKRGIGRIEFSGLPDCPGLEDFLKSLMGMGGEEGLSGETAVEPTDEVKIGSVRVKGLEPDVKSREAGPSGGERACYAWVYFYAIDLVRELFLQAERNEPLDLALARRVTRAVVSGCGDAPANWMGLATFKTNSEFLANHSVNVAIYAIALGDRLGLPRRFLVDLGLAALLHDVGEVGFHFLEDGQGPELTLDQWEEIQKHPVLGVKKVLGSSGCDEAAMDRVIDGIFSHHLHYDLSGFPKGKRKGRTSLVGSLISLADFYDLAVRPFGERRFPCFSDRVLELMIDRAGTDFDPLLARYFIRTVGVPPVGTLCRFDTGELGIVSTIMGEGSGEEGSRVQLLERTGERYRRGELISLGPPDRKAGRTPRAIRAVVDPNELAIDVAEYLIEF